jgi:hypothetical protein
MKTRFIFIIMAILAIALIGVVTADNAPITNMGTAITTDPPIAPTSTFSFVYKIPNSTMKVGCAGINTTPILIDYLYIKTAPANGRMVYDDSINQTWVVSKDKSDNGHYQIVTVNSNISSSDSGWFSWI